MNKQEFSDLVYILKRIDKDHQDSLRISANKFLAELKRGCRCYGEAVEACNELRREIRWSNLDIGFIAILLVEVEKMLEEENNALRIVTAQEVPVKEQSLFDKCEGVLFIDSSINQSSIT